MLRARALETSSSTPELNPNMFHLRDSKEKHYSQISFKRAAEESDYPGRLGGKNKIFKEGKRVRAWKLKQMEKTSRKRNM